MALRDIGTFLSRYFVIGFYVPTFMGVVALVLVLPRAWVPNQFELTDSHHHLLDDGLGSHLLKTAIVALLIALVLIGVRSYIFRLYATGFVGPSVNIHMLEGLILWRKRRTWDRLWEQTLSLDPPVRSAAFLKLSERFPRQREHLQPTLFGNIMRAYEEYAFDRWGMDHATVWPRIEALFTEQEQALHDEVRTSLGFALNLSFAAVIVGALRIVTVLSSDVIEWNWRLLLNLVPFVVSYLAYQFLAVDAALASGRRVRSSVDLHRLDLYRSLGVRDVETFSLDERELGAALSSYLLSGPSERTEGLGRQDWAGGPTGT